MRAKLSYLVSLGLLFFPLMALAATLLPVYSEQQTTITLGPGQPQFAIQLTANPSTGYSWFLINYDSTYIMPLKHYYTHSKANLPGASNVEVWRFHLRQAAFHQPQPRPTYLHFVYVRPWENEKPAKELYFKISTRLNE